MTRPNPQPGPDLIVIGASARAACFSAARAGFAPYWLDQFGDADLRAAFPGAMVPPRAWPAGVVAALEQAPDAPVIYAGALENHREVLRQIAARRTLLGNSADVCAAVRTPARLRQRLGAHGKRYPRILEDGAATPASGRWLLKPVRSGGGLGIGVAAPGTRPPAGYHLQEFVPGESFSAVYAAGGAETRLLGITRQWVGEADFHAPAFSWCGSLGPITPAPRIRREWEEIGRVLAQEFGLRGLFGVDAIVSDDEVTVIEVNPRYTASVEVLEAALGVSALALHMSAWNGIGAGRSIPVPQAHPDAYPAHGKACVFAPVDLVFHRSALDACAALKDIRVADVPAPGTPVSRSAPILTLLTRGPGLDACAANLRRAAAGLYQALGSGGLAG